MSAVFAVRAPDVVHETIDGETVIIDMANGAYYRLEAAAAQAWLSLNAGATAEQLCADLRAQFAVTDAEVESAVTAFLASLQEFRLVAATNGTAAPPRAAGPATATAAPFPGLAIHRFSDLQELLFLDPVHEVDESGWPAQAPLKK